MSLNNVVSLQDFSCERSTTCCFTGHRSRDLPFGGDIRRQGMKCLVSMLTLLIQEAYNDGFRTFISGMSEGIDIICAEIVHNMAAKKYGDIKLVCALPYAGQNREMTKPLDKYRYSMLLATCDAVVFTSPAYEKGCYKLRNQFMVDHSSRLIGAIKDKKTGSGTLQTVNMARRGGLDMKMISLDRNPVLYIDTSEGHVSDLNDIKDIKIETFDHIESRPI